MADVLIKSETMADIADAIREKLGVSDTYFPSEMPDAIKSIEGGGGGETLEITDITFSEDYSAIATTVDGDIRKITPTMVDGVITEIDVDGSKIAVKYDEDGVLTKVGSVDIDMSAIQPRVIELIDSEYVFGTYKPQGSAAPNTNITRTGDVIKGNLDGYGQASAVLADKIDLSGYNRLVISGYVDNSGGTITVNGGIKYSAVTGFNNSFDITNAITVTGTEFKLTIDISETNMDGHPGFSVSKEGQWNVSWFTITSIRLEK